MAETVIDYHTAVLDVNGYDYDVKVKYLLTKAVPATNTPWGEVISPAEPAIVEILSCHIPTFNGDYVFPLIPELKVDLEQEILEALEDE